MGELKPCPKCGCEAQMLGSDSELMRLCRVICTNEDCLTTSAINTRTRSEAACLWNLRPLEAAKDARIAELERALAAADAVADKLRESHDHAQQILYSPGKCPACGAESSLNEYDTLRAATLPAAIKESDLEGGT